MTERSTPPPPAGGPHAAAGDDGAWQGIQAFAATEQAELAELGALLRQLRAALPEPPIAADDLDADAIWRRVLQRLDQPRHEA